MSDTQLFGSNFVNGTATALGGERLFACQAATGETLAPAFSVATSEEIAAAGRAAAGAAAAYAALPAEARASFLEAIADSIEAQGDALLERAHSESGLPMGRLTGERGRTCGQLRLFARVVREGSWVDARIDLALPDRKPAPRPDIRRMLLPIGPVAVFGASNFPFAFSVAGGDTASALAAGCPVIVKAHPAHPGTSELVARSVISAAESCGIPSGVFALLHGEAEVGRAVVLLREIAAVAFTGSLRAGRALFDLAAGRPSPIPVYAEMGSVNPVFVLPCALESKGKTIAERFAESLTLGIGQFCTNPGLLIGIRGPHFEKLLHDVASALSAVAPGAMLTGGIFKKYADGVADRACNPALSSRFVGEKVSDRATPTLFEVPATAFLYDPELAEELFGPSAIAVSCESESEMLRVARALPGQLTTSVHFEPGDEMLASSLVPLLANVSGRVIANAYPTGVEVTNAMQHGGPYPATTDSRSTSVGTAAIFRFARPVAFQDVPQSLLPIELRDGNPRGIWRTVDGQFMKE
jgi:alpha-ketoglutaric semialdehyde dehydrogenase